MLRQRTIFNILFVIAFLWGIIACDSSESSPPVNNFTPPPLSHPPGAEQSSVGLTATPAGQPAPETNNDNDQDIIMFNLSGGFAGFCDKLILKTNGEYILQRCQGGNVTGVLEQSDLSSLQAWHDNLASFQMVLEDNPGGPDNLTTELLFTGLGTTEADETQQQIIFDWVNGLTLRLRQPQVPTPSAQVAVGPEGICPEVSRPAILVSSFGDPENVSLIDPSSLTKCDLVLNPSPSGWVRVAGGSIYYPVLDSEAQTMTIWRFGPDGTSVPLSFTATPMEEPGPYSFVLSEDASKIAWTKGNINFEREPPVYQNDLWVANIDGSNQVALLNRAENQEARYLEPIRFSNDNSTLFYALQPGQINQGALMQGFYDNIYTASVNGGQPQLIYACATAEKPLCISDISPDGQTLIYAQTGSNNSLVMANRSGAIINNLTAPGTDYAGQAVFASNGTLAFMSANLSAPPQEDMPPMPNPGYISVIDPPYTGQPRTILTNNDIATLLEWIDPQRLAYGDFDEFGNIGVSRVSLDGEAREISPNYALGVWR